MQAKPFALGGAPAAPDRGKKEGYNVCQRSVLDQLPSFSDYAYPEEPNA